MLDAGFSAQNGKFLVSDVRLGSRGDSFYEYLLYDPVFNFSSLYADSVTKENNTYKR